MPKLHTDRVPAAPFTDWLNGRIAHYETDGHSSPTRQLASDLGWHGTGAERELYRYRRMLAPVGRGTDARDEPVDTYPRAIVEDALDHAGVLFEDIYPDLAVDVEIEPDALCERCHETVTPIGGACPWCDTPTNTERAGSERMYCEREDRMVHPALDGTCWRCGGVLRRGSPEVECACGCGARVRRFDRQGRGSVSYVTGHAPRSLERRDTLPAGPFAAYLREQVAAVDPLTAVALKHRLKREQLVALLRGELEEIPREEVRVGLWTARRYGQPPRAPMRPGPSIQDLYPADRLSRTCPGCDGRKSPHAEMCKRCRVRRERSQGRSGNGRDSSVTPDLLEEARVMLLAGVPVREAARRVQPRTRCTNVDSVADALRKKLPRELWAQRERRRVAA